MSLKPQYLAAILIVGLLVIGGVAIYFYQTPDNGGGNDDPPVPDVFAEGMTITNSYSQTASIDTGIGWISPGYGSAREFRVSDGSSITIDDSDFYGPRGISGWKTVIVTVEISPDGDLTFDINKLRLYIYTSPPVLFGPETSPTLVPSYPTDITAGDTVTITVYVVIPSANSMSYLSYGGVRIKTA